MNKTGLSYPEYYLEIMTRIADERRRQEGKFGEQNHLNPVWLTILAEEFGEVAEAMLDKDNKEVETELIQVAAVAVAWLESMRRRKAA